MDPVPHALENRLREHVHVLAGLIGERNSNRLSSLEATRSYITRQIEEMGLTAETQPYPMRVRPAANIEVFLPGTKPTRLCLVIGAHYDSAPGTPGADDNASAVASLIEIIRFLNGKPLRRSIRCVFYDCEEPPHFATPTMGSNHHAKMLHDRNEKILGMICLESIGYFPAKVDPDVERPWFIRWIDNIIGGRHLIMVSNFRSIPFGLPFFLRFKTSGFFRCIPAALPGNKGIHALSDNRCYWAHGHRALMLTNTAMFRNPNYHLRSDLPPTLDYGRMAKLVPIIARAVKRTCT
jgi:hypothetical protein